MINWKLDYKPIDFHTHMGLEYCLYYTEHDADGMVRAMDDCNVDFVVCSPCEDLFGGEKVGRLIADAMRRYPTDKLVLAGGVSANSHLRAALADGGALGRGSVRQGHTLRCKHAVCLPKGKGRQHLIGGQG